MTDYNENYEALSAIIGENAEDQDVEHWLSTGIPELDKAISGEFGKGMPVGRIVEVFGPSSSGKTFLASMVMAEAQRLGGIAGFSDHERSFKANLAASLGVNVNPSSGQWFYKRPKTFEESVDTAMTFCETVRSKKMIPDEAPLVWVFDSVAGMTPHTVLYDKKGNRRKIVDLTMRDNLALAKACSTAYPQMAQFAEDNNMLILLLNQIRLDPGVMYGNPERTPGGKAAEFYASVRINLGRKIIYDPPQGKDRQEIGHAITAKCVKNKVSSPFKTADWSIKFNMNGPGAWVDFEESMVDYLCRIGVLELKGARITWDGKSLYKSQVIDALRQASDGRERLMALLPENVDPSEVDEPEATAEDSDDEG